MKTSKDRRISLSEHAYKKTGIHSALNGISRKEVIEQLIDNYLPEYQVNQKQKK